jgi:hypothetical protein
LPSDRAASPAAFIYNLGRQRIVLVEKVTKEAHRENGIVAGVICEGATGFVFRRKPDYKSLAENGKGGFVT